MMLCLLELTALTLVPFSQSGGSFGNSCGMLLVRIMRVLQVVPKFARHVAALTAIIEFLFNCYAFVYGTNVRGEIFRPKYLSFDCRATRAFTGQKVTAFRAGSAAYTKVCLHLIITSLPVFIPAYND